MTKSEKYRRLKALGVFLLRSEGNDEQERVVLYDSGGRIVILAVFLAESLKNLFFAYTQFDLNRRLLHGDLVISDKRDQCLFNMMMSAVYLFTFVYLLDFYFDPKRAQFGRFLHLSKFLLKLGADAYSKRFSVSREFAERFSKQLDYQVRWLQILVNVYSWLTFSLFFKNFYHSIGAGWAVEQILVRTGSSVLSAVLVLIFFYHIAIPAFAFFILYTKLLNAKIDVLTSGLDKLNEKSNRRLFISLKQLNALLKEFRVAERYFQRSLVLFLMPSLISLAIFPSIIIWSKRFDNPLVGLYVLNFFIIIIPIQANESFKRQFTVYLTTVHRHMAKSKNLKIKLKSMKIFDLIQTDNFFSFKLVRDIFFDLQMKMVPKILLESLSLTLLVYTFVYAYQNNALSKQ